MTTLEWLRAERARTSTRELAEALDMPQPSLRRILSTGKVSKAVEAKAATLRELARDFPEAEEDAPGIELDEEELEEYAELWGVTPSEAEDLLAALPQSFDTMSLPEVTDYIDSLYDALEEQGWEGELSDLWDLYYGYTPGSYRA
jgi:hypothetical protein